MRELTSDEVRAQVIELHEKKGIATDPHTDKAYISEDAKQLVIAWLGLGYPPKTLDAGGLYWEHPRHAANPCVWVYRRMFPPDDQCVRTD